MTDTKAKKLYSVAEACKLLSLGSTAMYNEINNGNLVVKKYGKRTLITAASLDDWVNGLPEKQKVGGCDE